MRPLRPTRPLLRLMPFGRALVAAAALALAACGGGGSDSPGTPPTTPPGTPPPTSGTPGAFVAVGSSARTVSLAWTPPAPAAPATTYAIERRPSGEAGDYTRIATVSAQAGGYVDSGLAASTDYSYRLTTTGANPHVLLSSAASTTDEEPLTTAAGAPLGEATGTTLAASGGAVSSADGRIRLQIAAGSAAADTEIETQPTANTAPDGRGTALRVRLSAVPSEPVTLQLRYEEAQAREADGLRIAVQRADGSWLSLPLSAHDKATRTLSATVPLQLLAAAQTEQAQRARPHGPAVWVVDFTIVQYLAVTLAPREARVAVGGTLEFVPYARVRGYDMEVGVCETLEEGMEACVMRPVMETRRVPFLNAKPGYARGWYVFLQEGGDATYGTVAAHGDVGATYTAPPQVPEPDTVIVSFQSTHQRSGRSVVLAAPVTIVDDQWVGTLSAIDGPSLAGTTLHTEAQVTWRLDRGASSGSTKLYRPVGTLGVVVTDDNCSVSITPSVQDVSADPLLVSLLVDESTQPATYHLRLITFWNASTTATCPDGSATRPVLAGWGWDVQGQLNADGGSFSGSGLQESARIAWSFHR